MADRIQQRLGAVDRYDWPWSWDSLTPELTPDLSQALVDWVLDYNDNFVTRSVQLVPMCWPVHPGLAREIAAIYAHWMRAFHHANATPFDATAFYDKTLPSFQTRITYWLGPHPEKCQGGEHDVHWDQDIAERVRKVRAGAQQTLQALDGDHARRLASTRSAPSEASLTANSDSSKKLCGR